MEKENKKISAHLAETEKENQCMNIELLRKL